MSIENKSIILFDGDCKLCNGSVRFIEKRDRNKQFTYIPLTSKEAENLINKFGVDTNEIDSVLLVQNDKLFTHSTAALTIARNLSGFWPLFYILIIIPKFIRDSVYRYIASHRHKWFTKIN
ncbi:MAG: DUF393 domain-containing protein [Calditrichaceae bacterium]